MQRLEKRVLVFCNLALLYIEDVKLCSDLQSYSAILKDIIIYVVYDYLSLVPSWPVA